jgi:hypothetical protein
VFITVTIDFDGSGDPTVSQSGGTVMFVDEIYEAPLTSTGNSCLSTSSNQLQFTTTLQIYSVAFNSIGDGANLYLGEATGSTTLFVGISAPEAAESYEFGYASFDLNPTTGLSAAIGKNLRKLVFVGLGGGHLFDNVAITMRVS